MVTQATYGQKYRDLMLEAIPELEFLWITADNEINIDRIRERNDYVTVEYFEISRQYFEPSAEKTRIIVNNGDEKDIIRQLIDFYGE